MSGAKTQYTTQVVIRVDDELFARIEALTAKLSPKGMTMPRSEVLRAALERGVSALESSLRTKPRGAKG